MAARRALAAPASALSIAARDEMRSIENRLAEARRNLCLNKAAPGSCEDRSLVGLLLDKRQLSPYITRMIRRFRHRGLRRLYQHDDRREINPDHAEKIARILARLDEAAHPEELDLPGFRLHPLKGDLAGCWSITVRANWRIIFRFEQGEPTDVDLVDYH